MNRAFIFDMDGVLVDSEHAWMPYERPLLVKTLGEDIVEKLDDLTGNSLRGVYEQARNLGSSVSEQEIADAYDEFAPRVYATAALAGGLGALMRFLVRNDFKLGLVTQSPRNGVDLVLARMPLAASFDVVLSIRERGLSPKPSPEGYLEALTTLNASPAKSVILEDSNPGIRAAKSAGAFVIGYKGLLLGGYSQTGADAYADTMQDVINIVASVDHR